MKKASLRSLALLLAAAPFAALAQAPVVDAYGQPVQRYGATGGQVNSAVSAQGEMFLQMQQLQNEVTRLRGLLEEQQYQIQQLRQEGLDRYQDLDGRMQQLQQRAQAPVPAPAVAAESAGSSEPADPAKEKLVYDACFDLVQKKDFTTAEVAFTAFLRKYPSSQYAGNAQYWLGEVQLAQGKRAEAGQSFAAVLNNYPQSPKVPDALLKQADVLRSQGQAAQASQLLQQLVSLYPQTSAAQVARRQLGR